MTTVTKARKSYKSFILQTIYTPFTLYILSDYNLLFPNRKKSCRELLRMDKNNNLTYQELCSTVIAQVEFGHKHMISMQ